MSLGHLLNDTIQIRSFSGTGGDGRFTYSDAVSYPAYIEHKPTMVMARNGAQTPSHAFLLVETPVDERDVLILPDGNEAKILQALPVKGFTGQFMWSEVYA
jgi:hypothetical protein